jgi:hypothetical protein
MDISLQAIKVPVIAFLHRFHIILFVIVTIGSLAAAILLLNTIIVTSGESNGYVSQSNNASFDQATIDQINKLKANGDGASSSLPQTGRTNPFVE